MASNSASAKPATAQQYFTDFLKGLHLPVTQSNLNALYGVAQLEGWNDRYNPLNVIQPEPGSTAYNSVGVQRYANYESGVQGAVTLFSNDHWIGVRNALAKGNNSQSVLSAFKQAYTWDPNVEFPLGQKSWGAHTIGPTAGGSSEAAGFTDANDTMPTSTADINIPSTAVDQSRLKKYPAPFNPSQLKTPLKAAQRQKIREWLNKMGEDDYDILNEVDPVGRQKVDTSTLSGIFGANTSKDHLREESTQQVDNAVVNNTPYNSVTDQKLVDFYTNVVGGARFAVGEGDPFDPNQWNAVKPEGVAQSLQEFFGTVTAPFAAGLKGLEAVGAFFNAILWIFSVDHFMKFLLYIFGFIAIAVGLGLVTMGAGKAEEIASV